MQEMWIIVSCRNYSTAGNVHCPESFTFIPKIRFFMSFRNILLIACIFIVAISANAQGGAIKWAKDGNSYYRVEGGEIVQYTLPANTKTVIVSKDKLTPAGETKALTVNSFSFVGDGRRVLVFTNTKKVWRYNTRGDYWLLDLSNNSLKQLGKSRPASTLMFAKISPD